MSLLTSMLDCGGVVTTLDLRPSYSWMSKQIQSRPEVWPSSPPDVTPGQGRGPSSTTVPGWASEATRTGPPLAWSMSWPCQATKQEAISEL